MNEQDFLASYNRRDFLSPLITVDAVLFTYHEEQLKVLLVKRGEHPEKGKWGLPGGFVDEVQDKCLEDTVLRKLKRKRGSSLLILSNSVQWGTISVMQEAGR